MCMERGWVREFWPFFVGVIIIVVGNIYLYGIQGADWSPVGAPFAAAILVVLTLEIGRALFRRVG